MSDVWRAYDEVLGRQVAVKVLNAQFHSDTASREWIRGEAQAAARLAHPHVTGVYDYGESRTDGDQCVPYVVMELVHGQTLAQRLKSGPPLPPRTALLICAQVAAALAAAHARGLVHRDIKPGNVMLSDNGVKVVDFGIAAVAGARTESPADHGVWGTPAYLAPERLAGGEVVPASDVYALGLLLYRLIADDLPWQADTVTEMLKAHRYAEPAPLPAEPKLPPEVADLVRRCLSKRPQERPTAERVARVLAAASGLPVRSEVGSGDLVVGAVVPVGAGDDAPWASTGNAQTRVVPFPAAATPPTGGGDPPRQDGGPAWPLSAPTADGGNPAHPAGPAPAGGGEPAPPDRPADDGDGPTGPVGASAADGDDKPRPVGVAAVGGARGPGAGPGPRPERSKRRLRAAVLAGSAAALLAVGSLAGFCAAGSPGGREPFDGAAPQPGASAPSTGPSPSTGAQPGDDPDDPPGATASADPGAVGGEDRDPQAPGSGNRGPGSGSSGGDGGNSGPGGGDSGPGGDNSGPGGGGGGNPPAPAPQPPPPRNPSTGP